MLTRDSLHEVLQALGDVLTARGHEHAILVVGGSSLLLLGLIDRPTADLDVIGTTDGDRYVRSDELPDDLVEAVRDVGRAFGLRADWINTGPSSLFEFGLPPGFDSRTSVMTFGGLEVHVAGRFDLVCFKLYAAVDHSGERLSKHFVDLQALAPTREGMLSAARWTRTHDPSAGFRRELGRILDALGVTTADDELAQ